MSHHPTLSRHKGQLRMYAMLRRNSFQPNIATQVDRVVKIHTSCAQRGFKYHHWCSPQLSSSSETLDFVIMDIFEPLPATTQGNQYISVINDQYSEQTIDILTSKTTTSHIANIFFDHWLTPYRPLTYLLFENGTQYDSKILCYTVRPPQCWTPDKHSVSCPSERPRLEINEKIHVPAPLTLCCKTTKKNRTCMPKHYIFVQHEASLLYISISILP